MQLQMNVNENIRPTECSYFLLLFPEFESDLRGITLGKRDRDETVVLIISKFYEHALTSIDSTKPFFRVLYLHSRSLPLSLTFSRKVSPGCLVREIVLQAYISLSKLLISLSTDDRKLP